MKVKIALVSFFVFISSISFAQNPILDELKTPNGILKIHPVLHGSLVLTHNNKTIYIDPYGGIDLYKGLKSPDIILLTDIHGDHLDQKTLDSIDTSKSIIIVPQAVANKLPESYNSQVIVLNNGQGVHRLDYFIKAIPMYNLPEEENAKHPKGRGNGYVLNIENKRIYISGDTEDIIEMRMLRNIDVAFVCMNLPYTMDINQAANAVLEFKPKIVYPYHYRGSEGFSDVEAFKNLVQNKDKNVEVRLSNWYPKN
ncbi:MBL fold metallo-hydrolase [Lutibacter flavus]|uniref:L-ascorbate metabolism protein UlaG, beta-lactamase superfamily n=1 Tax=Lutibacter flavus TaxID=691689 RepID=A0A238V6S8_9FLAO|nr:MBL fold metallo-hydrolase [Lutibacter flavus]SNR29911.1 L-ascorbate metabolism protein UlaG, beta-lactamase superfamily [Lutibacter flavus]